MSRIQWLLFLVLATGLTTTSPLHAGEAADFDAEAQQAAKEDADQKAEREKGVTGKYQRSFYGIFQMLPEGGSGEQVSPEVVGTFITNATDRKPDRTYLVKADNGNKAIVEALKRVNGKKCDVTGKLRVVNQDGEGKYLIVTLVVEVAPTKRAPERRKFGGL